jgi:hypothetical protein
MVEYLPSIAQVEVAAASRAAHEMFGFVFWLVAYAARAILAPAAQRHAGHIVAWARESRCACFRAMECRSPWRPSRPRISNSTRRRGPGRCEPCEFLMFGTAVSTAADSTLRASIHGCVCVAVVRSALSNPACLPLLSGRREGSSATPAFNVLGYCHSV